MKNILVVFALLIISSELVQPLGAINTPKVDEIESILNKVQNNLKTASQITSLAKVNAEKLVDNKVQEKKELKESVKKLSEKVEFFAEKMTQAGIDTSIENENFRYEGPLYEEWLEYRKSGGESDFEYYRLYKK